MQGFEKSGFYPADILLPVGADLAKWSVIACDQYTSDPAYWASVEEEVGAAPSTLRMVLPEAYLEEAGVEARIAASLSCMENAERSVPLRAFRQSMIYVERRLKNGALRQGLVGAVDLERYDFATGSSSPVRATEGTVLSRIPPRVKVRERAALELPHILLLCDDPQRTVIEPIAARRASLPKLYDFPLMRESGSVAGYLLSGEALDPVCAALASHADAASDLLFAVGDGNHSLATAKVCYENLKNAGAPREALELARFALVELVNIHSPSLVFEPIHRVAFGLDFDALERAASASAGSAAYSFKCVAAGGNRRLILRGEPGLAPVGVLQRLLDDMGARIDYIHGEDALLALAKRPGNIGFLLSAMDKSSLFPAVAAGGCLPRKTFSMGEADDKRFYLEARRIVPSPAKETCRKTI